MRLLRGFGWVAVLMTLLLVATACANDPGQQGGTGGGSEAASAPAGSEGAAPTAQAFVRLEDVCAQRFGGVQAPEGFKVRLVTDIGQVDDGTFNQFAFEGMEAAARCFGIEDTSFIETASQADYARNLQTVLSDQPQVVVTVGFLLTTDTLSVS